MGHFHASLPLFFLQKQNVTITPSAPTGHSSRARRYGVQLFGIDVRHHSGFPPSAARVRLLVCELRRLHGQRVSSLHLLRLSTRS